MCYADRAGSAPTAPAYTFAVRRYHVTTFGCQMNAHDSERIRGLLEELGLGEAADARRSRRARLQHLHDPREARPAARRVPRRREDAQGAQPRRGDRRRRLLRRGAARPDLRALPVHRRRLRPGHDPPPRRLARRRRAGRRAVGVRHRGRAPLLRGARHPARATVPGVGADLHGLQLRCARTASCPPCAAAR